MIIIKYIEFNKGFFIKFETDQKNVNFYYNQDLYDFGIKIEETFCVNWYFVKKLPEKILKKENLPDINHHYKLKDESLKSDKIPLFLERENVAYCDDDSFDWIWVDEYKHLYSLYSLVSDKQDPLWNEVKFKTKKLLKLDIDNIDNPEKMSYAVCDLKKNNFGRKRIKPVDNQDIINQEIDRIIFPKPLLHMRPVRLSSEASYHIVRQHIKNYINPLVAEITSDYDFCFTVRKRITIKPYVYKREILKAGGGSYIKPRFIKKNITYKLEDLFSMTHNGSNYKGYRSIKGFEGKDQVDLKRQIDSYLEHLMAVINEPIKECSICNNSRVIRDEDIRDKMDGAKA